MDINLFFFVEENSQWRITVSCFWKKIEPPTLTVSLIRSVSRAPGKSLKQLHYDNDEYCIDLTL